MAIVSGRVLYDPERYLLHTSTGIPRVPVVLFCPDAGMGAVALTDQNGLFRFTEVPPGHYQLTEDYHPHGKGPAVVSYIASAREMHQPLGGDPPISQVEGVSLPKEADSLDSLTPNSVFLELLEGNHPTVFFYDGPVGHRGAFPVETVGRNLITAADRGSFGKVETGSKVNSFAAEEAYPGTAPGFLYGTGSLLPPGQSTVVNTLHPGFGRHILSDHSSGQETGRMLLLNGNTGDERTAFTQVISLEAGEYLLSAWAMSENRFSFRTPARLGVLVLDGSGHPLLMEEVLLPSEFIPIWQQVGGVFSCPVATEATVRIYAYGAEGFGNDILLDDISLRGVAPKEHAVSLTLLPGRPMVPIGGSLYYTATIENTGEEAALALRYRDPLGDGLSFVRESFSIDCGGVLPGADPTMGVALGALPAHGKRILRYQAVLAKVPGENPIETAGELCWETPAGEKVRTGSAPVSLWASDRCFCEELLEGPLGELLRRSKLPELLGIPECELCKLLGELGCPDCAPVDVILKILGTMKE